MKLKIAVISAVLTAAAALFAMTGEEALNKFRGRMSGAARLTGIISWSGSSGYTYTGHFKYMAPDKIYVKFSSPGGKIVVSNGKRLYIFDPSSNICGIQDLGGASGGIAGLTSGYNAIASAQGNGYNIKLKNPDKHYSEINLSVDSSFMLKRAALKTKDGEGITFTLSNVDSNASVMRSIFDFSVPANAQVIKNPLDIR
jgi:outer membrane lipoprotein-sorting protein